MAINLLVKNPSAYWRKGTVTTSWRPIFERTSIPPEELVIRDSQGVQLRSQVDLVEPNDPDRALLVFSLDREIVPKPDDYFQYSDTVTVEQGTPKGSAHVPRVEVEESLGLQYRVKLINNKLEVWFELTESTNDIGYCYAGAATSVQLEGMMIREILDAFRAQYGDLDHDLEKRSMQIDQIRLGLPIWDSTSFQSFSLVDRRYRILPGSISNGPVRASVTIASEQPFIYQYFDIFAGKQRSLKCTLYRALSLEDDADYVMEQIYVKALPDDEALSAEVKYLWFNARYFMYMDMGIDAELYHFPHVPDWFAAGCRWAPFQGYGFANDAHVRFVSMPHPDFPDQENKHKTLSWELGRSRFMTCLHLFKRCEPEKLKDETGHAWYLFVFKPLTADISL